jgi:hypothetical protein
MIDSTERLDIGSNAGALDHQVHRTSCKLGGAGSGQLRHSQLRATELRLRVGRD